MHVAFEDFNTWVMAIAIQLYLNTYSLTFKYCAMLFLYTHPNTLKSPTPLSNSPGKVTSKERFKRFEKIVKWCLNIFHLTWKVIKIISGRQARIFSRVDLGQERYFSVAFKQSDIKSDWDRIPKISDRLSTNHLILFENARPKGIRTLYVRVYADDKLIAVMLVQLLRASAFQMGKSKHLYKLIFQNLGRAYTSIFPVMVVGHVFHSDMRCFSWDQSQLTHPEAEKLFIDVLGKLEDLILPSLIHIKDVNLPFFDGDSSSVEGFHRVPADFGMRMFIPETWQNMQDYLNDLTREYRNNYNRKSKKFTDVKSRELSLEEATIRKHEIWQLYKNILTNQPFSFGLMPADYILNLKAGYGERFMLMGFFEEDKLIAFYSAFIEDETYSVYYIGMDFTFRDKYDLYFNLLFHTLKDAILRKKTYLVLGRTAPDPKARLGCHPVKMNSAYRTQNLLLKWFLSNILSGTTKFDFNKYKPFQISKASTEL